MKYAVFLPVAFVLTSCSSSLFSRVESVLRKYDQPGSPGGAIMLVKDGSVMYKHAFGFADLESKTANTTATNFRLASVTKQFTAMSIMILAERGKLAYAESLSHFFPEFASISHRTTVRHLLTHTSGLIDYEDLMPESTTVPLRDRDVLALLQGCDSTYFAPGTQFRYSNSGFALLALIVERTSGMTFAQFLKTNIFDPLGMKGTVAFEKGISSVVPRAYGFTPDTSNRSRFLPSDQSLTSSVLGDGGIYSSVEDLFLWDQALYKETLVKAPTLQEAFTPAIQTDDPGVSYGFGWFVTEKEGVRRLFHSGTTVGFRNYTVRIPERRVSVFVLMNRVDGKPEELANELIQSVLR